jgi:hypothetical protein
VISLYFFMMSSMPSALTCYIRVELGMERC